MTWKELKDIIDNGLKENGMDDTAEIEYIDFSDASLNGHLPDVFIDKDDNSFCVS